MKRKIIAILLLLNIAQSVFLPSFVYALTSGPAAPEFTSFEPADASNLVNLVTGDMAYSLPCMEVPGPEGGYPINLSYHAGIQMEQEASWTGLGWNLNVGALNRYTVGAADDIKKGDVYTHTYDKGRIEKDYALTTGVGFNGINAGIGIDWGTYKSVGVSVSAGIGIQSYASAGISVGTNGVGITGGTQGFSSWMNVSNSGQVTGGIGYAIPYSMSSVGVSFSSRGVSAGVNTPVGQIGITNPGNVSSGGTHIFTESASMGLTIPIAAAGISVSAGFSYNKHRIWYSKGENSHIYGSIYADGAYSPNSWGEQSYYESMDSYSNPFDRNSFDNLQKSEGSNVLSSLAYDGYIVQAQGMNGSIMPRYTQGGILVRSNYTASAFESNVKREELVYNSLNNSDRKLSSANVYFSFDGEATGYYTNTNSKYNWNPSDDILYGHSYTGGQKIKNRPSDNASFYSDSKKRAGGTRHVEFFTNKQIATNANDAYAKGFMEYEPLVETREDGEQFEQDGIGAFVVTAEDGKTYHFALPVYQNESVNQIQKRINPDPANFYSVKIDNNRYAYTWLLTGIVGPDYVDRSAGGDEPDHIMNEYDYGYWVKFDYGKWADGYIWRSPYDKNSIGDDDDSKDYRTYTVGSKQIYYLDKVVTATHTAYFIKDFREDGLSVTDMEGISYSEREYDFFEGNLSKGEFHNCSGGASVVKGDKLINNPAIRQIANTVTSSYLGFNHVDPAGSSPQIDHITIQSDKKYHNGTYSHSYYYRAGTAGTPSVGNKPVRLLKLSKIVLVKNKEGGTVSKANCITGNCGSIQKKRTYFRYLATIKFTERSGSAYCSINNDSEKWAYVKNIEKLYESEFEENIIDTKDYNLYQYKDEVLKAVDFLYDYSLCKNVPNNNNVINNTTDNTNSGKLTLNKVKFKGKGDSNLMPSYDFEYYNIGNYNANKKDHWGMSTDFDFTTSYLYPYRDCFSKDRVHDWSLKSISTPTNAKVEFEYEPDSYYLESALNSLNIELSSTDTNNALIPDQMRIHNMTEGVNYLDLEIKLPFGYQSLLNKLTANSDIRVEKFRVDNFPGVSPDPSTIAYMATRQVNASNIAPVGYNVNDNTVTLRLYENYPTNLTDPVEALRRLIFWAPNYGGVDKIRNDLYLRNTRIVFKVKELQGGGIRVKKVTSKDEVSSIDYVTSYSYNKPNSTSTSGVTIYSSNSDKRYIPYVYELPSPNVMYECVTVQQLSNTGQSNGYTQTKFKIFTPSNNLDSKEFRMGNDFWVEDLSKGYNNTYYINKKENNICSSGCVMRDDYVYGRSAIVHNNLYNIGQVLEQAIFDNNNVQLSKTNYEYYNYDKIPHGVYQETFEDLKRYVWWNEEHTRPFSNWLFTTTSRKYYPTFLYSVSTTAQGITNKVINKKFDFVTGNVTEYGYYNSFNQEYRNVTIPAYEKYEEMGSKLYDTDWKNMLTQTTYARTDVKIDNAWQPIAAAATTWSNDWQYRKLNSGDLIYEYYNPSNENIWRKWQEWAWKGDINDNGTLKSFSDFEYASENADNWKLQGEVTTYDHYSNAIEQKDINMNYVAAKLGYGNVLPIIVAAGTNYTSFAGSSFEDRIGNTNWFGGEVKGASKAVKTLAHTGDYAIAISNSDLVDIFESYTDVNPGRGLITGKKYHSSIWIKGTGTLKILIYVDGTYQETTANLVSNVNSNGWQLATATFEVPSNAEYVIARISRNGSSGTAYFDDFRFHPTSSSAASYVYDKLTNQATFILDANNFYTRYVYDGIGRLTGVYTESATGEKKSAKYDYHYKKPL